MSTTIKVSLSIDAQELSWMRKSARKSRTNLSALFTEAARQLRQHAARERVLERQARRRLSPEQVATIAAEWA